MCFCGVYVFSGLGWQGFQEIMRWTNVCIWLSFPVYNCLWLMKILQNTICIFSIFFTCISLFSFPHAFFKLGTSMSGLCKWTVAFLFSAVEFLFKALRCHEMWVWISKFHFPIRRHLATKLDMSLFLKKRGSTAMFSFNFWLSVFSFFIF